MVRIREHDLLLRCLRFWISPQMMLRLILDPDDLFGAILEPWQSIGQEHPIHGTGLSLGISESLTHL